MLLHRPVEARRRSYPRKTRGQVRRRSVPPPGRACVQKGPGAPKRPYCTTNHRLCQGCDTLPRTGGGETSASTHRADASRLRTDRKLGGDGNISGLEEDLVHPVLVLHAAPKHIIALRAMQQRLWTGGGRLPSASVCAVLRVASTCIVRKGSKVAVVSPDALANRACSQPNDTVRKAAGPAPRVRPWLFVVVVAVAVVQGRPGPMYYVNGAPQDRPQQRPGQLVHVQDKAPSTRPSGGGGGTSDARRREQQNLRGRMRMRHANEHGDRLRRRGWKVLCH